jgi:hypothetical protein
MPFRGQANWAKLTSSGGKLTALACHSTKKVNKAEEPTNLITDIDEYLTGLLALATLGDKTHI